MTTKTEEALSQAAVALGASMNAIGVFSAVSRADDYGYIDCKFCLIAVARVRRGGQAASTVDDDGTELEHRENCPAKRALDEIEKAMKLIAETTEPT